MVKSAKYCLAVAWWTVMFMVPISMIFQACNHQGLASKTANGALEGCAEWAQQHNDAELEALCKAGQPATAILDLFAARRLAGHREDGGMTEFRALDALAHE